MHSMKIFIVTLVAVSLTSACATRPAEAEIEPDVDPRDDINRSGIDDRHEDIFFIQAGVIEGHPFPMKCLKAETILDSVMEPMVAYTFGRDGELVDTDVVEFIPVADPETGELAFTLGCIAEATPAEPRMTMVVSEHPSCMDGANDIWGGLCMAQLDAANGQDGVVFYPDGASGLCSVTKQNTENGEPTLTIDPVNDGCRDNW